MTMIQAIRDGMDVAMGADDRVVVIHKGRILADGSVAEVNQNNSSANLTQTFHRLINQVAA